MIVTVKGQIIFPIALPSPPILALLLMRPENKLDQIMYRPGHGNQLGIVPFLLEPSPHFVSTGKGSTCKGFKLVSIKYYQRRKYKVGIGPWVSGWVPVFIALSFYSFESHNFTFCNLAKYDYKVHCVPCVVVLLILHSCQKYVWMLVLKTTLHFSHSVPIILNA